MRSQKSIIKIGVTIPLLGILFCGCSVENKLQWLDDRSAEVLDIIEGEGLTDTSTNTENLIKVEDQKEETVFFDGDELTREAKLKIDEWLENNKLNRYGDPVGTNYERGTPLIGENASENIERFDYILRKMPDLLERIRE